MTDAPFEGLKVLDLGTFWAGPFLGAYLGAFGADVIKVESTRRPDGFRYVAAFPVQGDDWFERSGLFQATNLNKRGITIDLTEPAGQEVFERLLGDADVLIENFSPRVMEQLGFPWERVAEIRPELVMVRMPGFGLDGPWRDHVGFGNSFEYFGGLGWITGYPDGPPLGPGGYADPIVGIHAAVALQAALEHRDRTGHGQLIEVAQVDVVANVTAEQVIHASLTDEVLSRLGNRSLDSAPQGVYQCQGEDDWVALAATSDEQWRTLRMIMGPSGLPDADLADQAVRRAHHDEIDAAITTWTRARTGDEAERELQSRGVPARRVLTADRMYGDPQFVAVDYHAAIEHPVTGVRRYPGWPVRIAGAAPAWQPSPTLGQHNAEVLGQLGLSPEDLRRLERDGVIGTRPAGADDVASS